MPPPRHAAIPLGPIRLESRIGTGGMGVVYRGTHERLAHPVAVKILKRSGAAGPTSRRMFRAEARALARLDHPAIVYVYDTGFVPVGTTDATHGQIHDRSPYLVMEYAPGIPLTSVCGQLEWPVVRGVLLALLDALAHAHARGVLHLDLKPANVLFEAERGQARLTDFGLARLRDAVARDTGRFEGTPAYMAPEQVECRARLLGPWTDLYAIGCLAYALVCGDSPFRRKGAFAMCEAQVNSPPPPLAPKCRVPDGLAPWIDRLLSKAPRARFTAAADAAAALLSLDPAATAPVDRSTIDVNTLDVIAAMQSMNAGGEDITLAELRALDPSVSMPRGSISTGPAELGINGLDPLRGFDASESLTDPDSRAETDSLWGADDVDDSDILAWPPLVAPPETMAQEADTTVVDVDELERAPTGPVSPASPPPQSTGPTTRTLIVPTVPAWLDAADDGSRTAAPLPDRPPFDEQHRPPPGLGLFGLRVPPLRGRRRACGQLWAALRACADAAQPSVVLVRGPAGVGTSRLVQWMCETAHAAAGVTTIPVQASSDPSARDALASGFSRVLRADGLSGRPLQMHLRSRLGEGASNHEVEWHAWAALLDDTEMRPADRAVAAGWLLRTLAAGRPIIIWIDDAHHAGAALDVVEHMLDQRELPVLVACTVDDAVLAEHAARAQRLERLARGAQIRVEPLADEDHVELVRSLVTLDDDLAHAVAERTAGNPLFAVQMVQDWADAGLLEETPDGVTLRHDARPDRPADIDALWRARLERVLGAHSTEAIVALELAATLGQVVDDIELTAVCDRAGVDPSPAMFEALFDARLAYRSGHSNDWRFGHAAVRELILSSADRAGRLARHHRHCALVLGADPRTEYRVARHLVAAGDPGAAVVLFDRACDRALDRADVLLARSLVADQAAALDAAGIADGDPRRGALRLHRARLARHRGDLATAEAEARAVEAAARAKGHRALAALAREEIASGVLVRDPAAAVALLEAVRDEDPPGQAAAARCRLRVVLAYQLLALGRREDALTGAEDAEAYAERIGRDDLAAMARLTLALAAPDDARSEAHLAGAEAVFSAAGHRSGLAHCHNLRGERARTAGDLVAAERFYRSAAHLFEQSARSQALYPRLNLSLIELERGLYDRAEATLESCLSLIEGLKRVRAQVVIPVLQAACHAGRRRWADCAERLDAAVEARREAGLVMDDARRWAAFVAERAAAADRHTIVAVARTLADDESV